MKTFNYLDYIVFALVAITMLIALRKIGFFNWVKPSMEGKDGKASGRSLTNFWYVILNSYLVYSAVSLTFLIAAQTAPTSQSIQALNILKWIIVIYNLTMLILWGIISAGNITEGLRAWKGIPDPDQTPTVVESKTVTTVTPGSPTEVKTTASKDDVG